MSYRQAVLKDNPVGFWHLNGTSSLRTYATVLLEYANYQDWLNAEPTYASDSLTFTLEDLSYNGNHGAFTLGSANFIDILPLAALSSTDAQLAGCKINTVSEIAVTNLAQLYKMFYTGTENLCFTTELWLSFDTNPPVDNVVFKVAYGGNAIATAYVNNDRLYFTINGIDKKNHSVLSYTTYQQVKSWDSQNHILICYNKGEIYTVVNGIKSNSVSVSDNFIYSSSYDISKEFFFNIGPASSDFVVNDLAFYDCILSNDIIKQHISWALYDSSPQTHSKSTDAFFFDIKETSDMHSFHKNFSDPKLYNQGQANSLIIDATGMTLPQIPSLTKAGTGTISTTLGALSVTGTASAVFNNASKYFTLNKLSIAGQINWIPNSTSLPTVITGIDNIGVGGWVYLAQSPDKKLTLYCYSKDTNTSSIIAQVPTAIVTSGQFNFGLSINSTQVTIYISTNSGTNYYVSNNFPYSAYTNYNIYFGNEYSPINTSPLLGSIKNISIIPDVIDLTNYANYGQIDQTTISFNNSLDISQKGTWIYSIPSTYISNIIGTKVVWDSGSSDDSVNSLDKYVKFEFSANYGDYWWPITNGYATLRSPDVANQYYGDLLIRATIFSDNASLVDQPRFENLNIYLYKDLSIKSDAGAFVLKPRMGKYVSDTYSIRKNFFNILSRTNNFGINITDASGINSMATIEPASNFSQYQTVEFWFRPLKMSTYPIQTILDTLSKKAVLYYDTTGLIYQNGFSKVYINGVELVPGKYLVGSESYHIVCVYKDPSFSPIYLGGDQYSSNYTYGTYGFITMYSYALTQSQAVARYNYFISANTSGVAQIQPYANFIGNLSEYSGVSTSFNSGLPLISYNSPLT